MGGLVIDIILMYLFKSAVRVFDFFKSSKWERTRASFKDWDVVDPAWGCPSVKLYYEFVSRKGLTKGWDEIPFYMRWHARTYAESLSRGLRPMIRVNPENPEETQFFELDQKAAARPERADRAALP
jgi:hypothetical protein